MKFCFNFSLNNEIDENFISSSIVFHTKYRFINVFIRRLFIDKNSFSYFATRTFTSNNSNLSITQTKFVLPLSNLLLVFYSDITQTPDNQLILCFPWRFEFFEANFTTKHCRSSNTSCFIHDECISQLFHERALDMSF